MTQNPMMLPKVRADSLTQSAKMMPCAARVSSFIPGHRCSGQDTNVLCHYGKLGKGMGTKCSDLAACVGCFNCHELLDARDARIWWIVENYPWALAERIMSARDETQARWLDMGLIPMGEDWTVI